MKQKPFQELGRVSERGVVCVMNERNFLATRKDIKTQKNLRMERAEQSDKQGKQISAQVGGISAEMRHLTERAYNLLTSPLDLTENRINQQKNSAAIEQMAEELQISEEELLKSFQNGLRYNIKTACCLKLLDESISDDQLQGFINGFALHFRSTLSFFAKRKQNKNIEVSKRTMLDIASRGYVQPPGILAELEEKYKADTIITPEMIVKFAATRPLDTKSAVEEIRDKITEYQKQYENDPYITYGIIYDSFVHHTTTAENRIVFIHDTTKKLWEDYYVNTDAVSLFEVRLMVEKNIKDTIDQIKEKIDAFLLNKNNLREQYKNDEYIQPWIINYCAVQYPNDTEKEIKSIKKRIEKMITKYLSEPLIDKSAIIHASVSWTKNTEQSIEEFISAVRFLSNLYGNELSLSKIKKYAQDHLGGVTEDIRKFETFKEGLEMLKENFKRKITSQ